MEIFYRKANERNSTREDGGVFLQDEEEDFFAEEQCRDFQPSKGLRFSLNGAMRDFSGLAEKLAPKPKNKPHENRAKYFSRPVGGATPFSSRKKSEKRGKKCPCRDLYIRIRS